MTDSTRTIVVTGASSGIGAVAAERLAAGGDRVAVVGRDGERTRAVAARPGSTPAQARRNPCSAGRLSLSTSNWARSTLATRTTRSGTGS